MNDKTTTKKTKKKDSKTKVKLNVKTPEKGNVNNNNININYNSHEEDNKYKKKKLLPIIILILIIVLIPSILIPLLVTKGCDGTKEGTNGTNQTTTYTASLVISGGAPQNCVRLSNTVVDPNKNFDVNFYVDTTCNDGYFIPDDNFVDKIKVADQPIDFSSFTYGINGSGTEANLVIPANYLNGNVEITIRLVKN